VSDPATSVDPAAVPGVEPPGYARASLAGVLPAVATSLGVTGYADDGLVAALPPARRAVVVLVDGLGERLLRRRGGHAPFLRSLLPTGQSLVCGYPSTTATSMGSFGTGLPPGSHGLVGYEVLDPGTDAVFNELSWTDGPDPRSWQPEPTVFERAAAQGVGVARIGPAYFDGSGLTNAALRGGRFVAAGPLDARIAATAEAVAATKRSLVYLYWGDVDTVGHVHGCTSFEWGEEVERVDAALRRLAALVPDDTAIHVTADHGMVEVPFDRRIDLAHEAGLLDGVASVGGEPRAVQLYCRPGAAEDVAAVWRARLGASATVTRRATAVGQGWFGPVHDRVLPRIGDVLVNLLDDTAVVDSSRMRPELLVLRGLHGSVTEDEVAIPLLSVPPRAGS